MVKISFVGIMITTGSSLTAADSFYMPVMTLKIKVSLSIQTHSYYLYQEAL